jgi:hypothetical protein
VADREIHKARPIGELIASFIHGSELEQPLLERKVIALLPDVLGKTSAQYMGESNMKKGVLFLHIHSAALRSQLFEIRYDLVRKINEAVGAQVVKDIRLLG